MLVHQAPVFQSCGKWISDELPEKFAAIAVSPIVPPTSY
jgi:hypothetical protein